MTRNSRPSNRSIAFQSILVAGMMLATVRMSAAGAAASRPTAASADASIPFRRGLQTRNALLALIGQCDRDGGKWPDHLEGRTGPTLVYTKPGKADEYGSTVVLREPLEQHPDGAWVAYADGHVEYAASAEDLQACLGQLPILRAAIAKYGDAFGPKADNEVDPKALAGQLKARLTLRFTDSDGRPVAGALAGIWGQFGDLYPPDERVIFVQKPKDRPMISDDRGQIILSAERVFSPTGQGSLFLDLGVAPLYALDERDGLVALEELRLPEFDDRNTRSVLLRPCCRVTVELSSVARVAPGQGVGHVEAFAFKPGHVGIRAVFSGSESRPGFDLPIPPGDYGIYIAAHDCYIVWRYIHIEPGRRVLKLRIDLPPRRGPSELIGHPAPALRDIKGWKNGGPVRLADLRGKVVLLDFWGYWCGPCIASMPELVKLHDKYKDKGLVIVAVHNDSVDSISEMDLKLQKARKEYWGGRDLPFLIALDGGGETRVAGTGHTVRGATTAAYYVNSYPTTFIIGRNGNVLRDVKLYDPTAHAELESFIQKLVERGSGDGSRG